MREEVREEVREEEVREEEVREEERREDEVREEVRKRGMDNCAIMVLETCPQVHTPYL